MVFLDHVLKLLRFGEDGLSLLLKLLKLPREHPRVKHYVAGTEQSVRGTASEQQPTDSDQYRRGEFEESFLFH